MAKKSRSGDLAVGSSNIGRSESVGANANSLRSMLNGDDLAVARYNAGQALAYGTTPDDLRADPRADLTSLGAHIGHARALGATPHNARFVMPAADEFSSFDTDLSQADSTGPIFAGFQSILGAGDIAVVGYNTGQTDGNGSTADSIQIVLTEDVASGTVIFLTDRTWNGSAFSVSGSDGTTSYTFGSNMVAGTVINVTINGGFDPDQAGEAIYIYQGSDANTPTSFLYAVEIADGNTTFNASLANTGLVNGTTALAVALDSATYSGPTTEAFAHIYNGKSLLQNISDPTNWVGDDADGQKALDQPDLTGPLGLSADFSVWATGSGGGGGVVGVSGDATVNGGNSGINLVQLLTNLQVGGVNLLYAPQDIVFDTVHGKFFIADSDISGGHNRVLQGNISDLLGNSASAPPLTVLYSDTGTTASARIFNLQVDANNGIVYFDHGQTLAKVNYNTAGQTPITLANFSDGTNPQGNTNNFIDDFVINFATGTVYLSSHRIVAAVDGDQVSRNYIYKISGLDPSDGTNAFTFGNAGITFLPFSPDDDDSNNGITFANGEGFPQEKGTVEGLALSPDGLTLYIATAKTLYDDNGDGGFPGDGNPGTTDPILTPGGIYAYALTGNATGVFTNFYVPTDDGDTNSQTIQPGFGPQGLLDDIEIDPVTGKLYFIDQTGDQLGATNPPGDEGIWRVDTDGTLDPVFFQGISNINGLAPTSLFFNHAPTVTTHTEATPGVTEASNGPGSGSTSLVQPFLTLDVTDAETASLTDQLAGAVVRISGNFQSGATHQDTLTIGGLTSGTLGTGISFSYNAATGVMILSGANTFNNYEAAIALVRFNTSGDDPTAYGAAQSRTVSWSVSDGLNQSDEVSTTISVTGINDAPVNNGLGGTYSATEDTGIALTGISVTDVDVDPANQNIVVTLSVAHGALTLLTNVAGGITAGMITAGANGSASITVTATQNQINATLAAASGLTYAPTADYNGADAITVLSSDQGLNGTGGTLTDSDSKTINISAVVDIANDSVTVTEDSGANTLNLLANDTFENSARFISAVTQGSHGTVSINNNGTAGDATDDFVVYTVTDANYNGTDSFTYTVTSPSGVTETATVNVTVTAVNDPVTGAAPASVSLSEDSTNFAVTGLSIADVDATLAPAGVYNVTLSSTHGTMTLTTLTGLTFTAGDGTADTTMTFHGTLAAINTALATATYTPTANYNGVDAAGIVLQVTDTFGGIVATGTGAATSDSDSISVTVTAVNDAPVNSVPGATQTIAEDATRTFNTANGNAISVSDIDVGAGNLTVTLAVLHGTLTLSGIAGLSFGAGDGTADATMTFSGTAAAINTALQSLVYTATADYNGADTLTVTTSDNGNTGTPGALQDVDTVAITINAGVDIANDTVSVTEDVATSLDLLANDSFENAGRFISAVTQGAHGTVTINDNGTAGDTTDDFVVYTGAGDYNGADSFTYTVTSGGVTETATVNVTVTAAADIANDAPTTNEDSAVNVLVLGNDTFEGTPSITNIGAALHGTAVLNNNGTAGNTADDYIVYTPNADYNGSDSFTYTVTSGGVTETATVNVTVTAVADITADSISVITDSGTNNLNLLANDTFESAARFISAVTQGAHGTVAINNAGTPGNTADDFVTYTPAAGYAGPDSFTYTVTSGGVTETATVTVNVGAPNVAPVVDLNTGTAGIDDTNIYSEGGAGSGIGAAISVSDADAGDMIESATIAISDPESGDQLFVNLPLPPGITVDTVNSTDDFLVLIGSASASAYADALGQVGFRSISDDPTAGGTHGTRSIGVTVNDGAASSAPATMTLTVFGVDDAPVAQADAVSTDEATVVTGNVLSNNGAGADSDVDGPALSVAAVNGSGANVGTQITLASGALLTLNADGTFSYDPNHAFDATATAGSGASNTPSTDSFTYTLTGGGTATVTISIAGLDSNDILVGTAGADLLNGGVGADQMSGLAGNDVYIVDNAGDVVNENGGGGLDTIYSSVGYALGAEVERIGVNGFTTTFDINLTGNGLDNEIWGNDGRNVLDGGAGADIMRGFAGDDTYIVDNAGDVVVDSAGSDLVYTSISYSLGGDIERLFANGFSSTSAINLTGNAMDNEIIGNDGANQIDGGAGADILRGNGGNDIYFIDNAGDQVVEAAGGGLDLVYTNVAYTLSDNVERLGVNGFTTTYDINLTGNSLGNEMWGNDGRNILDGGGGADILRGQGGDDTYIVDNVGDLIIDSTGFDTLYTSVDYALGANVERLGVNGFTTTYAINLTGNDLDNEMWGNDGANVLDGRLGADILRGNGGADTFAFTTALGGGNVDQVIGFQTGVDKIALDDAIFTGLTAGALNPAAFRIGSAAQDADDRIVYDNVTGALYFDADGNGAGAAVQFATLHEGLPLTASDFSVI